MNKDKLKQYWNERPMECIVAGAAAVTAVAKLIDSMSAVQGRRAYAKQVNHRVKKK